MKRESDTKQKLLNTAVTLIWESSYGSISVDDICNRAGVNKGSFYYAFKSKSDLAAAAFEDHWNKKRGMMDEIFSSQVPPLSALKNTVIESFRIKWISTRSSANSAAALSLQLAPS